MARSARIRLAIRNVYRSLSTRTSATDSRTIAGFHDSPFNYLTGRQLRVPLLLTIEPSGKNLIKEFSAH